MSHKHLFASWILCFCLFSAMLNAQSISVVATAPGSPALLNTTVAEFTLDAAPCITGAPCTPLADCSITPICMTTYFILYGDGQFDSGTGTSISRTHKYPAANTPYTAKVFFAKKKDVDPPSLLTKPVITGTGGAFANPPVQMFGKNVNIGTSWLPVAGQQQLVILTIANTCGYCASGTLEFFYNHNQLEVNTAGFPDFNSATLSNSIFLPPTSGVYTKKCSLSYSGLLPGTQQSFFIPVNIQSVGLGSTINYKANLKPSIPSCNNSGLNTKEITNSTGLAAHDPNNKTVNIESICSYGPETTLQYHITFQNDGENFAGPIQVIDQLDPNLVDPLSVVITSYSDFCFYAPDPVDHNIATFTFQNIQLPGSNQVVPEKYNPSESYCDFTFTVNTRPNLPPGIIPNTATVVFYPDGSSLETNVAEVVINKYSDDNPDCQIRERGGQKKAVAGSSLQVSAIPNPFSDHLQVNLKTPLASGIALVEILDLSGRILTSQILTDVFSWDLETADWPAGMYVVRVQTAQQVTVDRVVKQ